MNRSSQYIHKRLSSLNPYQDHNGRKGRRRGRARKNPLAFPDATPTRRISTAAGQRLEEILDTDSSGTKKQGIQQVQNDRSNRFLPTSKYLSLLSEENDEAEVRGDSKVTVKSLPDRASTDQSTDNLVCEKAKNPEGYEIGQNLLLLRQKRKKLAMIFSVILAIMVGLAVGLGVGLGNINRKSQSSPQIAEQADPSDNTEITTSAAFPRGTHSIVTFLDAVQTDCTSSPSTWTCYPYNTFAVSPTRALTVFNWVIEEDSASNLVISSTSNPFALSIPPALLRLVDEGTATEHYRFDILVDKPVALSETITDDGTTARCTFKNTSLQASLYTRKARTYPTEPRDVSSDAAFPLWPFAAQVEQKQTSRSDAGFPTCYKMENGVADDMIPIGREPAQTGKKCSCMYRNFGSS